MTPLRGKDKAKEIVPPQQEARCPEPRMRLSALEAKAH